MGNTKKRPAPRARRPRAYSSELRQEQARLTADAILEAAVDRIRRGDRELSYAAIAKQAGVAIPTVYRHYPTQKHLIDALIAREERGAPSRTSDPVASLPDDCRAFFRRFDDPEDILNAGRLNVMWQLSRVGTVPRRRALFERIVEERCPALPEPQRTWLIDLGVVLLSSATGEAFRGYLDRSGAETAERVQFALEALLAHARSLSHQSKQEPE